MIGLNKILNSIEEEAEENARQTILKAQTEAKKILDEARLKATQKSFEIVSNADIKAKEIVNRAKSLAELERKNTLLKTRYKLINETILNVKNQVLGLNDADYFALMLSLCEKHVLSKKGVMIFSEKDLKRLPRGFKTAVSRIAKNVGGDLKVSDITRDICGGFILSYGDIEENCSIDSLINENRDALEDKLNSLFFLND